MPGGGSGALPAGAGGAGASGGSPAAAAAAEIVDTALNPLADPTIAQMLGFVEPPTPEEALSLRIYLFLIQTLRIEDAQNGQLFVKRFLEGPQAIWALNQSKIFAIKNLWSITEIPDDFLTYLKNIVGWTKELEDITDALDNDTLRRLIGSSVALWKTRGTEDTIVSILTLVTGARIRSWNWFDFRWVSDETGLGFEQDGRDPWLIAVDNDREMNVRIMDDGALDRVTVINLVKLMRPSGERIEITYLLLLDLFNESGDDGQWEMLGRTSGDTGSDILTVASGVGTMSDGSEVETMRANVGDAATDSLLWKDYVVSARIAGTAMGVMFRWTDDDNYYSFVVDEVAVTLELNKRVAGVDSGIASIPIPVGYVVDPDAFYMYRVQVTGTSILCYIDGTEIFNTTDSDHALGSAGIIHDAGGTVKVDEAEVLGLPSDTDFVDINS